MYVSGRSLARSVSAPATSEAAARQQSPAGSSTSPKTTLDLSPRRKDINQAEKIYEATVEFIRHGTEKQGKNPDTDPVAQRSIARYGSIRDSTIRALKQQPLQRPASCEPLHRVTGFHVEPRSPDDGGGSVK
jgi:hypothetical protein